MKSIRPLYDRYGVDGYYQQHGDDYVNPHQDYITHLLRTLDYSMWKHGIDLACGSGLVSTTLSSVSWIGIDPYLASQYTERTGNVCVSASIEQICIGSVILPKSDVIICSYAFDLFPVSYTNQLLWHLSQVTSTLITIRPNKKTIQHHCWTLTTNKKYQKSHMQVYRSG